MKTNLKVLALGAAVAGAAFGAAQGSPMSALSLRFGYNYLAGSDERDVFGNSGFNVGVTYDIPAMNTMAYGGRPSIELDYAQNEDDGSRLTVWGLSLVGRFDLMTSPGSGSNMYWGAGVGVFQTRVEFPALLVTSLGRGEAPPPPTEETKTRLGGKVLLGFRLQEKFFVEAGYRISGSVAGVRGDAFTVQLGFKF